MICVGEQLTLGEFCLSGRFERSFLRLGIMCEEENDFDVEDQLVECPYDSSHRVTFSRMTRHLVKCRKNFSVNEKAICPFNKNHTICVPELNYHKQTCPDKPEDFVVDSDETKAMDEQKENGANSVAEAEGRENGEESSFGSYCASDIESTGCVNGRPEGGGIDNYTSVNEQNDETVCETPTQKEDFVDNRVNGRCEFVVEDSNSAVVSRLRTDQPQNHNAAIETQSESDTASSESELSTSEVGNGPESFEQTTEVVHFDYKKFAPSQSEKEEFLKLISQAKENQPACLQEKYQVIVTQANNSPQWQQGYGSYIPQQFPVPGTGYHTGGVPHAYVTFANTYPMLPPMPAQAPYAHGPYGFPQVVQANDGFIPNPNHCGNYDYGGNFRNRPHYHRSWYKRRGYSGSYTQSRYNNNSYNSYNSYNGNTNTDTDSNSTTSSTHSDSGSNEENGYSLKIENHGQNFHIEPVTNGGSMKKTSTKQQSKRNLPGVVPKNGIKVEKAKINFEQFVKIEKVEAAQQVNGKIEHIEVFSHNQQPSSDTESNNGTKSEKDKQIRKLRKKLNEVLSLEAKNLGGAKLDCDQLKKLTRKREIEDQLAMLHIN